MEGTKLYFMQDPPHGLIIAASGTPDAAAFRAIDVSEVAGLVAAGATIDPSAQPLIDAQAPAVATPGETTGTQATPGQTGSSAPDAAANTTSTTGATDSAGSAIGTASGDAPLPGAAAATPAAGANGASILSRGSAIDAKTPPDSTLNTAGSLTPLVDADAGNVGASGAVGTSASASGATAASASDLSGTGVNGTTSIAGDPDPETEVHVLVPKSRVLSFIAIARNDLASLEQGIARNAHNALAEIEKLLGLEA